MTATIENHHKFSDLKLASEFVPLLFQDIAKGWNEFEPWILEHYSSIIYFLTERKLLLESHIEILHKFFDVFFNMRNLNKKESTVFKWNKCNTNFVKTYSCNVGSLFFKGN